ncbi:MAG: phenylalanine--tRNA ligase subunit beta [Acidiferrobacterales bacterium]
MKISEQWLREWVPTRIGSDALAERLTMAGLAVEAMLPVGPALEHVVVGEILSVHPHPAADRLRICVVSVGKKPVLNIVCGAPNAAAGLIVPVALPGAILPDGTRIERSEIRGAGSEGMLCSARELGIEDSSEGLMVLDADARPGADFARVLHLDDQQLDLDLTPNRGDCLSVAGLARELAALTGTPARGPAPKPVPVKSRRRLKVIIEARADCPHYLGRVIEGIDTRAVTPLWLRERLRRSGVRSIHPVVDVTNYVMLELGQPLHAFDLEKLSGAITVRHARPGEVLTLLDGKSVTPPDATLVIADSKSAHALAGIMGGSASAVSAGTTTIFLESAYFRPGAIAARARQLGLHTDSSHRFERGVDPELQARSLERASALILAINGGSAGPVVEQTARRHLPVRTPIGLRAARMEKLLGARIAPQETSVILRSLGMRSTKTAAGWRVTPPSWRFDIARECDLIEEVARIRGYGKLAPKLPAVALRIGSVAEGQVSSDRLRALLIDRDYQEAITYSFVDPAVQSLIEPGRPAVMVANPIAADMAAMRTSLWPGLLKAVGYNLNRQQSRVRLFEIGHRFLADAGGRSREEPSLAGVAAGPVLAQQWGARSRSVDFFDLKGDVEALLSLGGAGRRFSFEPQAHPALHPGQAAAVLDGERRPIGLLGALHPEIQTRLGLDLPVFLFELDLMALQHGQIPVFREVSRYPAIRRDIAVVVKEDISARSVMDCVAHVAGKLLANLELFDEYRGEGIDSGRKSLALGLTLQDSSRTLKEEEIEMLMGQVVSTLASRLGAHLRQ